STGNYWDLAEKLSCAAPTHPVPVDLRSETPGSRGIDYYGCNIICLILHRLM
ncbi:hypothetical protein A2U01_0088988, partial [Trifolium medium]|nr:hypothetical protein [Trifolium medium]